MARKLKALLIGVNEYTVRPHSPKASTHRPWSALDVAEILELIEMNSGSLFSETEVWPLLGAAETRRDAILEGLRWLFENTDHQHQLLLYFSGHAILSPNSSETVLEEVLCPSDTDWQRSGIRDQDLMEFAGPALANGACLEVILEACSASQFKSNPAAPQTPLPVMRFGCFFGGERFPAGAGTVWTASMQHQCSYSGPIPACSDGYVQGLFTYYFCRHFQGKSRLQLLQSVSNSLEEYRQERSYIECCPDSPMGVQVPTLYSKDPFTASTQSGSLPGLHGKPLSGDCNRPAASSSFTKPRSCGNPVILPPTLPARRTTTPERAPARPRGKLAARSTRASAAAAKSRARSKRALRLRPKPKR